jgi:hypothetical protein
MSMKKKGKPKVNVKSTGGKTHKQHRDTNTRLPKKPGTYRV